MVKLALLSVACLTCLCVAAAQGAVWRNALAPKGRPAPVLTLARAGKTAYVIVIPAQPTTQEQKAAADLAQWLGEMTGATFPVVSDRAVARPREISVGLTNRLATQQNGGEEPLTPALSPGERGEAAPQDLGDEGYAIRVEGERLFLLGGKKRGPINAVYALLEEDLGCRWYAGEESRVPHRPNLAVQVVPRRYVPRLLIRDPFYHDAFNAVWSLRNRTNAPGAAVPEEWGGHMDYDGLFVHTFNTLVPPDTYFKDHPEYFSLQDGRRTPRQLCLTNPEVVRIATESVLRILKDHPHAEIASVSANDGGSHCQCPACSALDQANGSPAGSLITFVNQVAEAVERQRPGTWISTLAYLDTIDPPTQVRPRANVAIQLCNDLHAWRYPLIDFVGSSFPESARYRRAIEGWAEIAQNIHIWDYTVNFSHYLAPMPNFAVLRPSVAYYLAHNVTGVMFQGNYQSLGGELTPLRTWVMAKLLWDPALDTDALVEDFIGGYYEEAAPAVLAYYRLLERAGRERGESTNKEGIRYPMTTAFLSAAFLADAEKLFDRARKLARTDQTRRRVELAALPLVYVRLCQGPAGVGAAEYERLLGTFEAECEREKITHLEEGAPDVAAKVAGWRKQLEAAKQGKG